MPPAKRRLDMDVNYTVEKLKKRQAARAILDDAKDTKKRLSIMADSLKVCDKRKYKAKGSISGKNGDTSLFV